MRQELLAMHQTVRVVYRLTAVGNTLVETHYPGYVKCPERG